LAGPSLHAQRDLADVYRGALADAGRGRGTRRGSGARAGVEHGGCACGHGLQSGALHGDAEEEEVEEEEGWRGRARQGGNRGRDEKREFGRKIEKTRSGRAEGSYEPWMAGLVPAGLPSWGAVPPSPAAEGPARTPGCPSCAAEVVEASFHRRAGASHRAAAAAAACRAAAGRAAHLQDPGTDTSSSQPATDRAAVP